MSSTTAQIDHNNSKRVAALRANALAALVMLVLEFGFGVVVTIYATLPGSDRGTTFFAALWAAIVNGPPSLAIHAVLGTLLLITGTMCIVRAAMASTRAAFALSIIGLLGILAAWGSGVGFIGTKANGASLTMGFATGVAVLAYALIVFLVPRVARDAPTLRSR